MTATYLNLHSQASSVTIILRLSHLFIMSNFIDLVNSRRITISSVFLFRAMPRNRDSPPPRPKRKRRQPARLRSRSPSPPSRHSSRSRSRTPPPCHEPRSPCHPPRSPSLPPPSLPRPLPHQMHRTEAPTQDGQMMAAVANSLNTMQSAFLQQQQMFMSAMQTLQTTLLAPQNSDMPASNGPQPSTSAAMDGVHHLAATNYQSQSSARQPLPGDITASTSSDLGEPLPIMFKPTTRPIRTTAAPLGLSLPHSLKVKIQTHKFVELADLISTHRSTDYTLDLTTEDGQPQFRLASKKKKPLTQNEWCQAMDTYIAVYVERYPQEIGQILSYAQTIKDLMNNRANWVWYDTQFRTDREYTLCRWDEVRQDLELRAFRSSNNTNDKPFWPNYASNNNKPKRSSDDSVPPGYCYAYHGQNQRCTNSRCSYKHSCPRCQARHPQFMRCTSSKSNASPSSPRSSSAKPIKRENTTGNHDPREQRKAK